MKKLIVLLLLTLVSCETTVPITTLNTQLIQGQEVKIYEIDGCEYILIDQGNATWGSHKGNCKNKIHI